LSSPSLSPFIQRRILALPDRTLEKNEPIFSKDHQSRVIQFSLVICAIHDENHAREQQSHHYIM
jgi:hypothetical protein